MNAVPEKLKPYSRRLKVRYDAWRGQVVGGKKFLCDGHTIIPVRCMVSKDLARRLMAKKQDREGGPATVKHAAEVWENMTGRATIECELSGFLDWEDSMELGYMGHRVGFIDRVRIDIDKLRLIDKLTNFDSIRRSKSNKEAVVFLRDGNYVGVLMPLNPNSPNRTKETTQVVG